MISGVFGLPGVGKSIFCAYMANLAISKKPIPIKGHFSSYNKVYTNFPCAGCYRLDFENLGRVLLHDCLIIVDEIQLFADSRNFRSFPQELSDWFSLHRKFHVDFVYCSQSYDTMDRRIRSLTDTLYMIDRWLFFVRVRPILQYMRIEKGSISEGYELEKNTKSMLYFPRKLYGYVDTDALVRALPLALDTSEFWDNVISYDFPSLWKPKANEKKALTS